MLATLLLAWTGAASASDPRTDYTCSAQQAPAQPFVMAAGQGYVVVGSLVPSNDGTADPCVQATALAMNGVLCGDGAALGVPCPTAAALVANPCQAPDGTECSVQLDACKKLMAALLSMDDNKGCNLSSVLDSEPCEGEDCLGACPEDCDPCAEGCDPCSAGCDPCEPLNNCNGPCPPELVDCLLGLLAGPLELAPDTCPATVMAGSISLVISIGGVGKDVNDQLAAGQAGKTGPFWPQDFMDMSVAGSQLYGLAGTDGFTLGGGAGVIKIAGTPFKAAEFHAGVTCGVVDDNPLHDLVKSACTVEASGTLIDWSGAGLPPGTPDPFQISVVVEGTAALPCD